MNQEEVVSHIDFLRDDLLSRRKSFLPSQHANTEVPADPIMLESMINEVNLEMARLGFSASSELTEHLCSLSVRQFCFDARALITSLEKMKGDRLNFSVLHDGFPSISGSAHYQAKRAVSIINMMFSPYRLSNICANNVQLSCGCSFHPELFDLSDFNACPVCQKQVYELHNSIEGKKQGSAEFAKHNNIVAPVEIGLANENDAVRVFTNLLSAQTSISASDVELISRMMEYHKDGLMLAIPSSIPQKEQLCLILGLVQKHAPEKSGLLMREFKTATDALRLAVYLSGGNASLESTKRFRFKLTRSQRNMVLCLLDRVRHPLEDMMRRRGLFLSLGKYLHVGSERKRHPNAAASFYELRNNHSNIQTFNKQKENLLVAVRGTKQQPKGFMPLQKCRFKASEPVSMATIGGSIASEMHEKLKAMARASDIKVILPSSFASERDFTSSESFAELLKLLATRPGEFARWMDVLLRQVSSLTEKEEQLLMHHLEVDVLPKVKFSELLKLNAYFATRNQKSEFRSFNPKGKVAKIQYVKGDDRDIIDSSLIGVVSAAFYSEVHNRLAGKDRLGHVFISPELKNIVLPVAMRSSSSAMTVIPRGSRVPVSCDCGIVRMYMYWKGDVDFDISAVALDDKWNSVASSSYMDYEDQDWAKFSGDIRSAPAGAAECIDINLEAARKMGIRYVVMFNNIYDDGLFEDYNAFAGVMEAKDDLVGDKFEPSAARNRLDLVGDAKGSVPLVLDIESMQYIVTDVALGDSENYDNSYSERSKLVQITRVIEQDIRIKPTMFDLALSHAIARADKISMSEDALSDTTANPVEFDFKFDMDFALNLDDVMANWMVG